MIDDVRNLGWRHALFSRSSTANKQFDKGTTRMFIILTFIEAARFSEGASKSVKSTRKKREWIAKRRQQRRHDNFCLL